MKTHSDSKPSSKSNNTETLQTNNRRNQRPLRNRSGRDRATTTQNPTNCNQNPAVRPSLSCSSSRERHAGPAWTRRHDGIERQWPRNATALKAAKQARSRALLSTAPLESQGFAVWVAESLARLASPHQITRKCPTLAGRSRWQRPPPGTWLEFAKTHASQTERESQCKPAPQKTGPTKSAAGPIAKVMLTAYPIILPASSPSSRLAIGSDRGIPARFPVKTISGRKARRSLDSTATGDRGNLSRSAIEQCAEGDRRRRTTPSLASIKGQPRQSQRRPRATEPASGRRRSFAPAIARSAEFDTLA